MYWIHCSYTIIWSPSRLHRCCWLFGFKYDPEEGVLYCVAALWTVRPLLTHNAAVRFSSGSTNPLHTAPTNNTNNWLLSNWLVENIFFDQCCSRLAVVLINVFWQRRSPCCQNTVGQLGEFLHSSRLCVCWLIKKKLIHVWPALVLGPHPF